tara:strand:- start:905 stop:1684 length:780 start_codon:yes stop_codon:yes gene_type:complete
MAMSLSNMAKKNAEPPAIYTIYGTPKVGKTSLALEFPDPIYVNTPGESPPKGIEFVTPGEISSLDELLDLIGELLTTPHDRKTLVIDSADGLEPLVWDHTCRANGWSNIEAPDYGKGYIATDEHWRELLRALEALAMSGMAVVFIAHAIAARFDSPVTDPYSRWQIKLHKRAAALIQEASSVIAFIDFRMTLKTKDVGFKKAVSHGEGGGDRQIHLEERPGFVAGNRFGMPSAVPYKAGAGYSALAKYLTEPTGIVAAE